MGLGTGKPWPLPSFHLGVRNVEAGRHQTALRVVLVAFQTDVMLWLFRFTAPLHCIDD